MWWIDLLEYRSIFRTFAVQTALSLFRLFGREESPGNAGHHAS